MTTKQKIKLHCITIYQNKKLKTINKSFIFPQHYTKQEIDIIYNNLKSQDNTN